MATKTRKEVNTKAVDRLSYKIPEAAERLGVSILSIRRLIDRGLLKPCRVFRHVLIPADQLEKLLRGEKP